MKETNLRIFCSPPGLHPFRDKRKFYFHFPNITKFTIPSVFQKQLVFWEFELCLNSSLPLFGWEPLSVLVECWNLLPIKCDWEGREENGCLFFHIVQRLAIMSLNCLEQCLALNCFLNRSYYMLQKAWNQNPFKKPVRKGSVSRTLAEKSIYRWEVRSSYLT